MIIYNNKSITPSYLSFIPFSSSVEYRAPEHKEKNKKLVLKPLSKTNKEFLKSLGFKPKT